MSESENGNGNPHSDQQQQQHRVVSPGRVLGARSASPAKRSAADMEGAGNVPGSFVKEEGESATDFDQVMAGMRDANGADESESMDTSGNTSGNTSNTSFLSDAPPPPYSAGEDGERRTDTDYSTADIDQQVATVHEKTMKPLDEGQKCVVVSAKWLDRVRSRSSAGLEKKDYPKEARQGPIGPVDNSDIVPEGAFNRPHLLDQNGRRFIPLKPGFVVGQDVECLNDDAWGIVVGTYGIKQGQHQIERYARNTADADAATSNIMYELYPPIFMIRKVPQPNQEDDEEHRPAPKTSIEKLRLRAEGQGRGQNSPDDAARLVSSRQEKFQKFLARAKEAAGIPKTSKVKVFKLLDPSQAATNSTSTLSASTGASNTNLVIEQNEFDKLEIGKELDPVEADDQTNNDKYNGSSTMEHYVLAESHTLVLEEQIRGPGGGEFSSNKKALPKFKLAKTDGGSKPGSAPASGRTSPAPGSGVVTRGRARKDGRTRGVVGLTNLGNTCYMNSALQCIRSVEELAVYFLSDRYKNDINMSNPLGHKGVMAKQYANLLNMIYSDSAGGSVTPSQFKKTIGSIQPLFSGYGQQDSQEFLSFLVDALHEDLNRIIKKPYNENPDSDDKTVHDPQAIKDLGEVYRNNHKARNDSVAMDLFSGFYKNTMECPKCDKVSITFDPYSLLTVQLPIENTFQHTITFVPLRSRPVNHRIDIDKNSSIKMLKDYIASKHPGVEGDRLWMIEVYNHKIYKVFDDSTTLAEANVQANDYLFMYELEDVPSNAPTAPEKKTLYSSYNFSSSRDDKVPDMDDPKAERFAVPVFSRQKNRSGTSFEITLHPMYITVTRDEAQDYNVILKKVLIAASRLTSRPFLTEFVGASEGTSQADEMDRDDQITTDGTAQVNDASSSEDGYVKVSVSKAQVNGDSEAHANGISAEDDRPIPANFMDPEYQVPQQLQAQMFNIQYAQAENNLHCASMSSIQDRSVRNMEERVKRPARRNSVQSSSSDESTTSTASIVPTNEESDGSDADEMDKSDLVIGESESHLGLPTTPADDDDNESTPDSAFGGNNMSRKGRRKNNKGGKGRRGNKKTYGKKARRAQQQNRGFTSSQQSYGNKFDDEDDNPYYIKLGEGIVLDWTPEALDALFGGSGDDPEEMRGHFVSHSDGKGLPVVNDPVVEEKRNRREARRKHGITLDDCFVETGKREVLSEDNAWYCNRCKEMRRAAKTLDIWTIPDILVVHLKRFSSNRSFRDKIDVLVDYPIEGLDMTDRIGLKEEGKEYIYDLFAVDNHYGGLGGGHYTALARNFNDGQWYDYNDSHTSKIGESRLHSAAAYLLFYRRRSDKPLGPPELQNLVLDSRNPPASESAEETAEDSDAGEGRLGGPRASPHGSSSALTGAGVGAGNRAGSGGVGVGSSLTTMRRSSGSDDEGAGVGGYSRGSVLGYPSRDNPSWDFTSLGQGNEVANSDGAGSDADSTVAQLDDDRGDFDTSMADSLDLDEPQRPVSPAGFDVSNNDGEVLKLESAGQMGEMEQDGEAVDIHPSPTPMQEDGR